MRRKNGGKKYQLGAPRAPAVLIMAIEEARPELLTIGEKRRSTGAASRISFSTFRASGRFFSEWIVPICEVDFDAPTKIELCGRWPQCRRVPEDRTRARLKQGEAIPHHKPQWGREKREEERRSFSLFLSPLEWVKRRKITPKNYMQDIGHRNAEEAHSIR